MENALYVGLSRQMVLQNQMTLVANNIANANTPGYREQELLLREEPTDPRGQGPSYSMVYDYGQYTSTLPGVMQTTGAPLDIALNGPGFIEVTTPQGPRYTRAGSFTLNQGGELITPNGDRVSPGITIPDDVKEITIDENGIVSTENGQIGQITMMEFANTETLVREGNGLYRADDGATPVAATNTRVTQGMLEGSNVQGVKEMTKMIEVLREYQSVQRMIQNEHELERNAIQKLTTRN